MCYMARETHGSTLINHGACRYTFLDDVATIPRLTGSTDTCASVARCQSAHDAKIAAISAQNTHHRTRCPRSSTRRSGGDTSSASCHARVCTYIIKSKASCTFLTCRRQSNTPSGQTRFPSINVIMPAVRQDNTTQQGTAQQSQAQSSGAQASTACKTQRLHNLIRISIVAAAVVVARPQPPSSSTSSTTASEQSNTQQ